MSDRQVQVNKAPLRKHSKLKQPLVANIQLYSFNAKTKTLKSPAHILKLKIAAEFVKPLGFETEIINMYTKVHSDLKGRNSPCDVKRQKLNKCAEQSPE